jgi:hypothetical protein
MAETAVDVLVTKTLERFFGFLCRSMDGVNQFVALSGATYHLVCTNV